MEYPFFLSFIGLFVAVILITQSSITIYNYSKKKQAKDLNYWWSVSVLVISIIAAIGSMMSMFFHRGSAQSALMGPTVTPTAGAPAVTVANLQAQAEALQNLQKAQAETAKAFKT